MAQGEDWLEALHHYQRAVFLNPRSSFAHASLTKAELDWMGVEE